MATRVVLFAAILALSSPAIAQEALPTTEAAQARFLPPQRDSVWNGALIGVGVGAAGAWVFTRANCGPAGHDKECAMIAGLASTVTFIPAGAIGGAVIDWFINKKPASDPARKWQLSPSVGTTKSKGRTGVAVLLSGSVTLGRGR